MRTEIATLGEFGLIDHLTEGIQLRNESTRYGIGDDAAVLSYPADKEVLVTTDLLLGASEAPGLQGRRGQLLRHLCHERHSQTDYRFVGII